jgi:phage terminase large subunit-like protein
LDLGQARRHAGTAEALGDGAVAFGENGLAHGRLPIVISV